MYEILYSIAIIAILFYIFYSYYNPKLIYVRSRIDNKIYVVRNTDDKQQAADLLANVSKRLHKLVSRMYEKYGTKHKGVNLLKKRFKGHEIRESLPKLNQTSYSLNKGEKIVLCIRARNKKQSLTDINTITFVALHEMAHVMTISIGHKKEFWENFRFILAHAIKWKIYAPVNYSLKPKPYCGIKITDSPLNTSDINKYFVS
tara:strand:- start:511 stop:1116 length:606 start_codon:yes stop_codon:yes gene_type:complete